MGQAQINVRTRACSRTSIARTKQAALTHNVRGKELTNKIHQRLRLFLNDQFALKHRLNTLIQTSWLLPVLFTSFIIILLLIHIPK